MPGDISISVESYGCTMNHGEAESIMWKLEEAGYKVEGEWKKADICIIVTCVVIETTERKMLRFIADRLMAQKPLIVLGCLASHPGLEKLDLPEDILVLGPDRYDDIVSEVGAFVEEKLGSDREIPAEVTDPICEEHPEGSVLKRLGSGAIGILPIAQGCIGACSYCITKKTRGDLISYEPDMLKCELERLVQLGRHEVQVTAQDTACYGREKDDGILLPQLIEKLVSVDGEFMIRIGMMRPDTLAHIIDDLIEVYKHEKVFKFLHLPVQSGSDAVLAAMNRTYTVEEFEGMVTKFRKAIPDLTLSTDVIVGYPTESDADRQLTMDLLERLEPDVLNITRFSARPHTEAAKIKPKFHGRTTKAWSRAITVLHRKASEEKNQKWLGWKGKVFVTEKGKEGTSLARMVNYKQVVVEGEHDYGKWVEVEVTGVTHQYLVSKPI